MKKLILLSAVALSLLSCSNGMRVVDEKKNIEAKKELAPYYFTAKKDGYLLATGEKEFPLHFVDKKWRIEDYRDSCFQIFHFNKMVSGSMGTAYRHKLKLVSEDDSIVWAIHDSSMWHFYSDTLQEVTLGVFSEWRVQRGEFEEWYGEY